MYPKAYICLGKDTLGAHLHHSRNFFKSIYTYNTDQCIAQKEIGMRLLYLKISTFPNSFSVPFFLDYDWETSPVCLVKVIGNVADHIPDITQEAGDASVHLTPTPQTFHTTAFAVQCKSFNNAVDDAERFEDGGYKMYTKAIHWTKDGNQ